MEETLQGKERAVQEFTWYFPWTDARFKDDCGALSGASEATRVQRGIILMGRNKAYRLCFCHPLRGRVIFSISLSLDRILHVRLT